MVARLFELPGIAAGQQTSPSGSALGIAVVRLCKEDALLGQAVEARRLDVGAAVRAEAVVRGIVGDQEQNVRPIRPNAGTAADEQAPRKVRKACTVSARAPDAC